MRFVLRLCVPDRPGALGEVATAAGSAGIDIASLDVIDRGDGVAIDDLCVEADAGEAHVRAVFEGVAGVVVEALCTVTAVGVDGSPTSLAARISEQPADQAVACLVEGLPYTLAAAWAVAVTDTPAGLEVLAASPEAPSVPAGLRLPFLPLAGTRRLPHAAWMPESWRVAGRVEAAATTLTAPYSAVLVGRVTGARFRRAELARLSELVRVAAATGSRRPLLEVTAPA